MPQPYLVDTNVLLRWIVGTDPQHPVAKGAINAVVASGGLVFVAPQNVAEVWNVLTRPEDRNGFGMLWAQAAEAVRQVEVVFTLVYENEAAYVEWKSLVESAGVFGVQVHDARLAALMRANGITHILTFIGRDFARFGVTTVHPDTVTDIAGEAEETEQHDNS